MHKKNIFKQIVKGVIICLCVVISLALLTVVVLNIAKFAIYSNYYSIKADLCKNPGLSDGFVCQGICAYEQEEKFLVSGYMIDKSPSRIYVTDTKNSSYYVSVIYGSGKAFTGHSGGIAMVGNANMFISGMNNYLSRFPKLRLDPTYIPRTLSVIEAVRSYLDEVEKDLLDALAESNVWRHERVQF